MTSRPVAVSPAQAVGDLSILQFCDSQASCENHMSTTCKCCEYTSPRGSARIAPGAAWGYGDFTAPWSGDLNLSSQLPKSRRAADKHGRWLPVADRKSTRLNSSHVSESRM